MGQTWREPVVPGRKDLERVYGGQADVARARFEALVDRFGERFGLDGALSFHTAPGRTEIIGNHTDHNGGRILAASITMDTICAAAPNGTEVITVVSEGYPEPIVVDLTSLDEVARGGGSTALVAGMAETAHGLGWQVHGFDAVVSTQVIPSAGVSSSASFEMLVCSVMDHLFNGGTGDFASYARIGQAAENRWWGKASGLMDQMACAVGGTILLDFSNGVRFERVDFSYAALGCDLVIVNTGKGHADLADEYSSIPVEMRAVAHALGVENLCDADIRALLRGLPSLREELANDRALLRALHYFEECRRVDEAVAALREGRTQHVLDLIDESGSSSWRWLQNAYLADRPSEEPIALALALSELFLREVGGGACRLHGGGFAGVIMCAVPTDATADYLRIMTGIFGEGNVFLTNIRQVGTARLG